MGPAPAPPIGTAAKVPESVVSESVVAAPVVYLLDLNATSAVLTAAETRLGLLAAGEHAFPPERRLSRTALRLVLASAGHPGARAVPFMQSASGKPRLQSGTPAFSVSHAAGHTLIAIAASEPVGADLEGDRTVRLPPHRCRQVLAAARGLGLHQPDGDDARALIQAWTALEAWAKASGEGIGRLLTRLGIMGTGSRTRPVGDAHARAMALRDEGVQEVARLDLALGLAGSICLPPWLGPEAIPVQPLTTSRIAAMTEQARTAKPVDLPPLAGQ